MRLRRASRRSVATLVAASLVAAFLAVATPGLAPAAASDDGVRKQGTLGDGYALVATDGGIFNYGDSDFFGSTGALPLNKPIVGMEYTPTGEGYWLVASDGGIFTFGDAAFFGSTGNLNLNQPIVGMAATPTGRGYYLVAADGGIFTFGDARFLGSAGSLRLARPIVGMAVHPVGNGYWLVAADGGIFSYGGADFFGSTGGSPLNQPIVDIAASDTGDGYYMVATDGGIFTFGDATFRGSEGARRLNKPINGMTLTPTGEGYWLVASDGGIFTHGDAVFYGSRGGAPLNKPVVGMAATPFSPGLAPDFVVDLEGSQEPTGGDVDGSGFARLDFTDDELCYYLQVDNVEPATMAHIHEGPVGVNGPIVFTFDPPDEDGISLNCGTIDPSLSAAILADPQRYYVNVHSQAYPSGAVRGQLFDEIVVAATATNALVVFFASAPENILLGPIPFSGVGAGETIAGIDIRPLTGDLYVLTVGASVGRLYMMNTADGSLGRVGTAEIALTGSSFGFDFNPTVDLIRLVSDADENMRIDPDDGTVVGAGDTALTPSGDVTAAAYTNNVSDATATTLYGIDSGSDNLVTLPQPNGGVVQTVGPLGVDVNAANGFDIGPGPQDKQNTALLVARTGTGTGSDVYAVNTASTLTPPAPRVLKLGTVGDGSLMLTALTLI